MTRYRSADWDAIAAATPNDVTAGKVVSQGGEHYSSEMEIPDDRFHSRVCPPIRRRREIRGAGKAIYDELVGKRLGRLVVVGVDARQATSGKQEKKARWVVRCDCGAYEHRKATTLRKPNAGSGIFACVVCARDHRLAQNYKEMGSRPFADFFELYRDERPTKEPVSDGVSLEAIADAWGKDAEDGV